MNVKNFKINSLISNAEWLFVSFLSKIKDKKISKNNVEITNVNIRNFEDEFKFLTTEEIYYFLGEGRDFWKQIRINEKIKEISLIKEEQYHLLNESNIIKIKNSKN